MFPPAGPARRIFTTALVVAVIAFAIAAGLIGVDRSARLQATEEWLARIQAEAETAAESLDADLRHLSGLADELAAELESGELSVTRIEARLEALVAQHPYVFGGGVMFRPYVYAHGRRLAPSCRIHDETMCVRE